MNVEAIFQFRSASNLDICNDTTEEYLLQTTSKSVGNVLTIYFFVI